MKEYYQSLEQTLDRRLRIIGDTELRERNPEEQLRQLQAVSEELDALAARLPADADGQLRHFLERRSYVKALDFLRQ